MATETRMHIDTTIEPDDVDYIVSEIKPVEGYASAVHFTVIGDFKGLRVETRSVTHLEDGQHVKYTDAYREACIDLRGELQRKFNDMVLWLGRHNSNDFTARFRDVAFPPARPWTPYVPITDEQAKIFRFENDEEDA